MSSFFTFFFKKSKTDEVYRPVLGLKGLRNNFGKGGDMTHKQRAEGD
jgi:hypothetical protein